MLVALHSVLFFLLIPFISCKDHHLNKWNFSTFRTYRREKTSGANDTFKTNRRKSFDKLHALVIMHKCLLRSLSLSRCVVFFKKCHDRVSVRFTCYYNQSTWIFQQLHANNLLILLLLCLKMITFVIYFYHHSKRTKTKDKFVWIIFVTYVLSSPKRNRSPYFVLLNYSSGQWISWTENRICLFMERMLFLEKTEYNGNNF